MANLLDLTSCEIEILQLVLAGRTNKAIAAEFCITEIAVRTRPIAGIWVLQQGIEAEAR